MKVKVKSYHRTKPKRRYGLGGEITSFNQMPSSPGLVDNAGPLRESPQQDFQSRVESFNAEQNWRQGHQLTGMQKEQLADERGGLMAEGKLLGMGGPPGTTPAQSSYDAPVKPPAPPGEDPSAQPLGFPQRRPRQSAMGLGQSSLLGMAKGGKVPPPDLRKGGPVAGGPPGIDTVPAVIDGKAPAALDNGEYVLPPATVAALGGKAILDNLVLSTTGQEPVGYNPAPVPPPQEYAAGGNVSGWTAGQNRMAQIESAVNGPPPAPPVQAQPESPMPQPAPPQNPQESKLQTLFRVMTGRRREYSQGGAVQGYRFGGLTDEELRAQSPPYAKGPQVMTDTGYSVDAMGRGRQPLPMTEDSRFIPTADTAGSKSNRAWAQTRAEQDPAVAQAVAAQLQANQQEPVPPTGIAGANRNRGTAPPVSNPRDPRVPAAGVATEPPASPPRPPMPRGGVQPYGTTVPQAPSQATASPVPYALGQQTQPGPAPQVAQRPVEQQQDAPQDQTPMSYKIGQGLGAVQRALPSVISPAYAAREQIGQAVTSGLQNVVAGMTGSPVPSPRQAQPSPVQPPAAAPGQAAPQAAAAPTPPGSGTGPGQYNAGTAYKVPKELQADVGTMVGENQGQSATELAFGVGTPAHRPPLAPTAGQLRRSPLGLTPDAFNPTGPGYIGTVGGAPQGVTDAAYAAMSLPEKSAAKVKSMEDATAAIRSTRNARREAEGSPPVGGWKRYLLDQQLKAQGNELNQDLYKEAYKTRLGMAAEQQKTSLGTSADILKGAPKLIVDSIETYAKGTGTMQPEQQQVDAARAFAFKYANLPGQQLATLAPLIGSKTMTKAQAEEWVKKNIGEASTWLGLGGLGQAAFDRAVADRIAQSAQEAEAEVLHPRK